MCMHTAFMEAEDMASQSARQWEMERGTTRAIRSADDGDLAEGLGR
jgi:hypothetical protein